MRSDARSKAGWTQQLAVHRGWQRHEPDNIQQRQPLRQRCCYLLGGQSGRGAGVEIDNIAVVVIAVVVLERVGMVMIEVVRVAAVDLRMVLGVSDVRVHVADRCHKDT